MYRRDPGLQGWCGGPRHGVSHVSWSMMVSLSPRPTPEGPWSGLAGSEEEMVGVLEMAWQLANAGWSGGPSVTGLQMVEGPRKNWAEVPKRSSPTSVLLRAGLNF